MAEKSPEDIGYIEVNGGGSPIVDSVEIKALSDVYQLNRKTLLPCRIGSVKPNVGHCFCLQVLRASSDVC